MTCSTMWGWPFLWLHACTCTRLGFYNAGSIGSNNGPFTRNATARKNSASDNVDFSGKLLDTWTSWIFWTFGSLGGALGFLTSRTFWQFWHLGDLDPFATWIVSRSKPDTWIYDHNRHVNIKPKPDINKNQLNFLQKLPSYLPFLFLYLNDITFHSIFKASTLYFKG